MEWLSFRLKWNCLYSFPFSPAPFLLSESRVQSFLVFIFPSFRRVVGDEEETATASLRSRPRLDLLSREAPVGGVVCVFSPVAPAKCATPQGPSRRPLRRASRVCVLANFARAPPRERYELDGSTSGPPVRGWL